MPKHVSCWGHHDSLTPARLVCVVQLNIRKLFETYVYQLEDAFCKAFTRPHNRIGDARPDTPTTT